MRVGYLGIRVYLADAGGTYVAHCLVERGEDKLRVESKPRATVGEALAEVLELSKALEP